MSRAAEHVGVKNETLRSWIEAFGRRQEETSKKSDKQRIRELERELRSFLMERDILKGDVGIFSQRPKRDTDLLINAGR